MELPRAAGLTMVVGAPIFIVAVVPWYLVPLYAGLGVMACAVSRVPQAAVGAGLGLVVLWAGLVAAHIVNLALGDETPTGFRVALLAFDIAMAVALLAALLGARGGMSNVTSRSDAESAANRNV